MPQSHAGHLTPGQISAYLAGTIDGPDRQEMERHMTACDSCRREMVAASELIPRAGSRKWVAVLAPVAAAAAIAALLLVPSHGPGGTSSTPVPGTVLRSEGSEAIPGIEVVEPSPGATVATQGTQFRWKSAGEDPLYRVTLTDDGGDVVWTATASDTVLGLPTEIILEGGRSYFWFVDALLPGARSATSGIQRFTVQR
jgi:hypothetical protein